MYLRALNYILKEVGREGAMDIPRNFVARQASDRKPSALLPLCLSTPSPEGDTIFKTMQSTRTERSLSCRSVPPPLTLQHLQDADVGGRKIALPPTTVTKSRTVITVAFTDRKSPLR